MSDESTMLFGRDEVARLLTRKECMAAVEHVFRLLGEGQVPLPGVLGIHCAGGGFHIKAGLLPSGRNYFAAKVNANFPGNPDQFGLPTIQGVIVLCDADNGRLLAVMDSMEVTARRTAAATAVAAKYLARRDSKTVTVCGCGQQGREQLRALGAVFPLAKVFAYDAKAEQARRFAEELGRELKLEIQAAPELGAAAQRSDICVTCTTSKAPLLMMDDIAPGTFIAAVGADHPEKQELHPALMAASKVIADLAEQCAMIGDLHHAMAAGTMGQTGVHAELGEVVAGTRPGRTSAEEVIIFDSTGIALEDVASAALVYEKALRQEPGMRFDFAA